MGLSGEEGSEEAGGVAGVEGAGVGVGAGVGAGSPVPVAAGADGGTGAEDVESAAGTAGFSEL